MKKLLFVLLIVALASYLFVGCMPVTPSEGEGEGEGEVEQGVLVAISDSVKVGNYTYVSAGDHDITVTFPAPVAGLVSASISPCSGDYKAFISGGASVVLFPDATKKIWTGSGTFATSVSDCCASYIEVVSGECADVVCIAIPVIVDGCPPYAQILVEIADCECEGCALTFSTYGIEELCEEAETCCGDDCSGLASWSVNIYDYYPFDVCCDPTICEEPIATDSGVCPIDFTTACLPELVTGYYYAIFTLVDNVGLEQNYYARIDLAGGGTAGGDDCRILGLWEGTFTGVMRECVIWETADTVVTADDEEVYFIGDCEAEDCYYVAPVVVDAT